MIAGHKHFFSSRICPCKTNSRRCGITSIFYKTNHLSTWYNLTDANGATLYLDDKFVASGNSGDYDYKFRTPWKFNLSLGHTFGTNVAIGAEYEFSDYASSRYTAIDHADNQYFKDINETIKNTLKGQHTLKLGLEYKPVEPFSIRLGYNFVSSAYDKKGYKTILFTEPFTDTDFTNWGPINRITCGLGSEG